MKKRECKINDLVGFGRGLYRVKETDKRYYHQCIDCHLMFTKSCSKVACKADERTDGKNVVFVSI